MLEEYFSGVYHDERVNEFYRVVETDSSIGLIQPGGDPTNPEYVFGDDGYTRQETKETLDAHFERVPQDAVDAPVQFIHEFLDEAYIGQKLTDEDLIGLQYARSQVTLTED